MSQTADVLIVGAGPAGMAAALQVKRSGLNPLLVEKDRVGGSLLNAERVENYPGFPQGISGADLVGLFQRQIENFGIEIHRLTIKSLCREGDYWAVDSSGDERRVPAVIIASGSVPLRLNIPGEDLPGVYHEIRDLPVDAAGVAGVIGGGDVAFDYALALAQRGIHVRLMMRSQQPSCLPLLAERVRQNPAITMTTGVETQYFVQRNGHLEIGFKDNVLPPLPCDAALIAVGRRPNMDFLPLKLQSKNLGKPLMLFAGDVVRRSFRQVGIAVGDGLRCAMEIVRLLEGKR